MSCAGRGYDVVSGSVTRVAVVGLGAGRPERPAGLDGRLEQVEPLAGRRERDPVRRVLAVPPAGADAEERPTAGERVEGGRGLGGDPGRAEGDRRAQRAERQAGVEPGDQPEGHPRLRDRLPGGVDLRDLDQVVHQGDPGEAGLVGRQRHRPAPSAPGSSPQGNRDSCSTTLQPVAGARLLPFGPQPQVRPACRCGWGPNRGVSATSPDDDLDVVPALGREVVADGGHAAYLVGRAWRPARGGRARRCGGGTPRRGCRGRRRRRGGRRPGRRRARHVRRSASRPRVSMTVVRPRPRRAATMRSRRSKASVEASRSAGPEPTMPRRSSEETISARR